MCGRYSLDARPEEIADAFALAETIAFSPRYNIAPTQTAPVVCGSEQTNERRLRMLKWGLPGRGGGGRVLINARSETVDRRPAFRRAFRRRRCLVPATGFFEWQKLGGAKQPFSIRPAGGGLFAFAGIWDALPDGGEGEAAAYTILTTRPNRTVSAIHDRMPVILAPQDYAAWLDPAADAEALRRLLGPAPEQQLTAYPVSTRVNSPDHDDPACLRPLENRDSHLFSP